MKWVRDPLLWLTGLFIALLYLMPHSAALFNALIPGLPRPVYQQESFVNLTLAHFWLVAVSSVIAIVLGTEGDGLARTTIAHCDYTVMIPMQHGVDSLNVAAAGAVAFWELRAR